MKKRTKNLVTTLSAAALGAAAVLAVDTILTDIAIKRKIPALPEGMQDIISGGMSKDPNMEKVKKAREEALATQTEDVTITTAEGLALTGHIVHAKTPKRIIIAMHGWRSYWENDYGASLEFMRENDCTVLFPEQRGTGESEGDYIGFGVLERKDCYEWIKYADENFSQDLPIYLMGVSMGSTTVLMALGYDLPERVKGVIADCGFTSPHAIWTHILSENLHIPEKLTYPFANRICNKKAKFDGDEYSTLEALSTNEIPVLFVHGTADTFVPVEMTLQNYNACNGEKELLIVPDAGHAMSYHEATELYQKTVLDFFEKHDN